MSTAVRTIRRLLVANRGEIARRVMRTCRALGIETVAVFSEPDRRSLHVREADEAVALGGAAAAESYLRVEAVIEAARRTRADAVHPGYGFLAEEPRLAAACDEAGLAFLGPTAEVMARLGSKSEAKRMAERAGVPVLPGASATGDLAEVRAAAERIGLPLLIKADAGGGGRGMRLVRRAGELERALEAARREAGRSFGDDSVFLEAWRERARHVEVQILGDGRGEVVALFERDCTVQRRHQKVIEEAPSPAVDASLRERLQQAAIALGRALAYRSAGTVEFLLAPDGALAFLEVNARLQVEHPVTEAVTGLDLVALQIAVAEGRPLPAELCDARCRGHAIEARLYAEDPERDLLPSTGRLRRFHVPGGEGLRIESGVGDGSEVTPLYDPLLAKVIAWAPSRAEAIRRLARALRGAEIHGVRHNRDLLVAVLEHEEFRSGAFDTRFLDRHPPLDLARSVRRPEADRVHAVAAALAAQAERRRRAPVLATLPSGWRNVPSADQRVVYETAGGEEIEVGYRFARDGLRLRVAGDDLAVASVEAAPEEVVLEAEGLLRRFRIDRDGDRVWVESALGSSELRERPRHPPPVAHREAAGSLAAPMPGTVVRVTARAGDRVRAGEELLVLEAMKMEHRIEAPGDGRLSEIRVRPGEAVEAGAVLAVIEYEAEERGEGAR